MSYRTPENLIRQIMAESHAPALKIPEPDRVADAIKALGDNGVTATKKDDNTIAVDPADTEKAINIMNNSFFHGKTQAAPKIVSSNSIEAPELPVDEHEPKAEPHPPEGGMKLGEALGDENSSHLDKEDGHEERAQDIQPVDANVGGMNVQLNKRSIVNRMENQLKKIDEEKLESDSEFDAMFEEATADDIRALDEVSKQTLKNYLAKNDMDQEHMDRRTAEDGGKITRTNLKKYAKRDSGRIEALKKIHGGAKVRATNEDFVSPAVALVRRLAEQVLLDEARGERKVGEVHSDCGKHTAKIYKNTEWGEHIVKFHINGEHHEPSNYHTDDHHDAFGTAKHELNRLTKLNGALKEATEEDIQAVMEDYEQLDELSKKLLSRYAAAAEKDSDAHRDTGRAFAKMASKGANTRETASNSYVKAANRLDGAGRARAKIKGSEYVDKDGYGYTAKVKANEETEAKKNSELDEASVGLTRPYIGGAKKNDGSISEKKKTNRTRKLNKEETELSELSRPTLSNYMRKRSNDYVRASHASKDELKKASHESEYGSRVKAKIHNDKSIEHDDAKHTIKKHLDRAKAKYNGRAKVNATNEEVEQIDELSKPTLAKYAKKASDSLSVQRLKNIDTIAKNFTADKGMDHADIKAGIKKSAKRHQGLDRALDRLQK